METTREIYWNVGHGVVWPMYALSVVAVAIFAWGFCRRIRVYRLGKHLNRRDHVLRRLWLTLRNSLAQWRVLLVPAPGIFHSVLFWGFSLLFLGTALIMLQIDVIHPIFNVEYLHGGFYEAFSLVLDLAGLAAVLTLGGLLVRRFLYRPKGLPTIRDDYIVHALLFAILLTGFVVEGLRMAATEIPEGSPLVHYAPIGYLFGRLFTAMSPTVLQVTHEVLWWFHMLLALAFIALIPFTKLRHLFTAPAKYFFVDLSPKGTLATIDLDDEAIEQYGAAKVSDLTWKDIFDADACTRCKRCQDRCPAWSTEKPLSPMEVVLRIGETAFADPGADLAPRVTEDALWACTTCRACQEICPTNVEHVNKIIELRRNLTLMEGAFAGDEVRTATEGVEVNGNPFGLAYASRAGWAEGLDVQVADGTADVDVLYFVGCYASFDRRNQAVARSLVEICAAAGIRLGILGKDEKCCGEPVRKLGNEYLYQMTAAENVAAIDASGARRIVTTCPHCYNTLVRDYRDLGLTVPVEHSATFVERLLRRDRLRLEPTPFEATYHDSCYLGRYAGIFAEPRAVLTAVGGKVTEMERRGRESFCCGGGGGRILADEKLGTRISEERVKMASATGAPLLVSSCPFCLTMFEDGIKATGREEELRARDLAELVAERLEGGNG